MNKILSTIIMLAVCGFITLCLLKYYPHAIDSDQDKLAYLTSLIILVSISSSIISRTDNLSLILKQIGGWLIIALLILTGYSYQLEIKNYSDKLAANILPGYAQGNGDGSVTFYAGSNGHFEITALLNDVDRVQFLFDTGASTIALTKNDAEKIGINTKLLKYDTPLNTANGTSWAARTTIAKVQIGPIVVHNVQATVSSGGLDGSLLGMSFLRQLRQYVIQGNTLTLVN